MSKPPKNNKHHYRRDFSYFNNPNYFGFYNHNWDNNYFQNNNTNNQEHFSSWNHPPTPTKNYQTSYPDYYLEHSPVYNHNSHDYQNYSRNENYPEYLKDNYNKRDSNWDINKIKNNRFKKKKKVPTMCKRKYNKKKQQSDSLSLFKINKNKAIDEIDIPINCIEDLLKVGQLYCQKDFKNKNYSINVKGLYKMNEPLGYLKNMIGLNEIKIKILEQIIFFSQDIHHQVPFSIIKKEDSPPKSSLDKLFSKYLDKESVENNVSEISLEIKNKYDMLHTIIEGPPGVGKTQLGKVLAKIYLSLGIIQSNKFRIATRKDFIGEYLGHTAIKTQKVIDSCMGGVLFIDEAYSLGSGDNKKDSFSKECIDTLNQNLSENKGKFVCIIAGYKDNLEHDFFSVNPGLQRRFPFRYTIEKYNPQELLQMFINKVSDIDWSMEETCQKWFIDSKFIENKMEHFQNFGGDIESWLLHCKIEHSKRVFGKCFKNHKILNQDDILKGYQRFLGNKSKGKDKNENSLNMYL